MPRRTRCRCCRAPTPSSTVLVDLLGEAAMLMMGQVRPPPSPASRSRRRRRASRGWVRVGSRLGHSARPASSSPRISRYLPATAPPVGSCSALGATSSGVAHLAVEPRLRLAPPRPARRVHDQEGRRQHVPQALDEATPPAPRRNVPRPAREGLLRAPRPPPLALPLGARRLRFRRRRSRAESENPPDAPRGCGARTLLVAFHAGLAALFGALRSAGSLLRSRNFAAPRRLAAHEPHGLDARLPTRRRQRPRPGRPDDRTTSSR